MADPLVLTDPIPVYAGDTWSPLPWERGYLTDPADSLTFVGYDYSVWAQWRAQWRPAADDDSTVIELTVIHDEAAGGKFAVTATPEQTRLMGDSGVFDIQVSDGAEQVLTLLRGKTNWTEDVTRD